MNETKTISLSGIANKNEVHLNGIALSPYPSQKVYNHSPNGFSWGYGGSGPAQLALAVLLQYTDVETALRNHQDFKWSHIEKLPYGKDFAVFIVLDPWIKPWIKKMENRT